VSGDAAGASEPSTAQHKDGADTDTIAAIDDGRSKYS